MSGTSNTPSIEREDPFVRLNFLLSVSLVIAALVLAGSPVEVEDDLIVGLALVSLTGYALYRQRNGNAVSLHVLQTPALLGLWLIAFSLQYSDPSSLFYVTLIAGVLLFASAAVASRRSLPPMV